MTLIETVAVVVIIAILAAIAMPSLRLMIDGQRLDGAATQLATDIQLVRSEAVARNLPLRLTLHTLAGGSCYVIHTGNAADCHCDGSGPAHCSGLSKAIKTTTLTDADRVSLVWNASSLLFDPVHGTSTPTATLRLLGTEGREIHHVVNVMGRVRSCSAHAALLGYKVC